MVKERRYILLIFVYHSVTDHGDSWDVSLMFFSFDVNCEIFKAQLCFGRSQYRGGCRAICVIVLLGGDRAMELFFQDFIHAVKITG